MRTSATKHLPEIESFIDLAKLLSEQDVNLRMTTFVATEPSHKVCSFCSGVLHKQFVSLGQSRNRRVQVGSTARNPFVKKRPSLEKDVKNGCQRARRFVKRLLLHGSAGALSGVRTTLADVLLDYHRRKLIEDSAYREQCRDSQRNRLEKNPTYMKTYMAQRSARMAAKTIDVVEQRLI
jgi:hypothetical protein